MLGTTNRLRRAWLIALGLMVITVALYWPVRHYDFVEYDDPDYVFENQTVRNGITWYGVAWSVVDAHAANWHPVTWISHMLDCEVFGVKAGPQHLVNVLLHGVNSALLFLLLRAMTGAFWRSALVAALFAWHPLRVESVAWISERKDVLSGFFFMLTLLSYSKYAQSKRRVEEASRQAAASDARNTRTDAEQQPDGDKRECSWWYYLTVGSFALGLLSKPMLVTVPFLLLLLDYWPLARIGGQDGCQRRRLCIPSPLWIEKLPFLFLSAGVALVTVLAQKSSGAMISLRAEGPATRVGTVLAGYPAYLGKIFWPHDLTVLYLRPQSAAAVTLMGGVVVLVGISGLAVMNLRLRPYLAVGWLWFLGMLLPVSGVAQAGLQSIADRYTYLPAIGLGIMVVWGLGELRLSVLPEWARRGVLGTATVAVLIVCAGLTRHQLSYWQNTQTLMGHALTIDPNNYVAHQDLGRYYSKLGQGELAREHRQRVRELDPALGTLPDSE